MTQWETVNHSGLCLGCSLRRSGHPNAFGISQRVYSAKDLGVHLRLGDLLGNKV